MTEPVDLAGEGGAIEEEESRAGEQGRSFGRKFSAKSGIIGHAGERYCMKLLEREEGCRVLDVSTRKTAVAAWQAVEAFAQRDGPMASWAETFVEQGRASRRGHKAYPGFDLLMIRKLDDGRIEALGYEVKSTDGDTDTLDVEWTANEREACEAVRTGSGWAWPVTKYVLLCVTELCRPLETGGFAQPKVFAIEDPLAQRSGARLARIQPRPRYRLLVPLKR